MFLSIDTLHFRISKIYGFLVHEPSVDEQEERHSEYIIHLVLSEEATSFETSTINNIRFCSKDETSIGQTTNNNFLSKNIIYDILFILYILTGIYQSQINNCSYSFIADMAEWSRALDIRLSDWFCNVSKVCV
jgi:hypothetical protein